MKDSKNDSGGLILHFLFRPHLALQLRNVLGELCLGRLGQLAVDAVRAAPDAVLLVFGL